MQGSTIRGLAIWHCVLFGLFTFASLPFWFPARSTQWFGIKNKDPPQGFMIMLDGLIIVAAITEFFLNFDVKIDHISAYNSIDNFYQPAPCGTTRPLKSGILLKAEAGKLYNMMWVSTRPDPIISHVCWATVADYSLLLLASSRGLSFT